MRNFLVSVTMLAAVTLSGAAVAQRLGSPNQVSQDPMNQDPMDRKKPTVVGPVIETLDVKPGEKKVIVFADGAMHSAEGSGRNAITVSLTVSGAKSTVKISNQSGKAISYTAGGDINGTGQFAPAGTGTVKGGQTSDTDYPVALKAFRLSQVTSK